MHILITGAAGMIGRKLTERLAAGRLHGQAIERLSLTDVFTPARPAFSGAVDIVTTDLATPGAADKLVGGRPDIIFHTAGIVSAEAELDFEKGYRSNLDGMLALLEAVRRAGDGYRPKLIFTSSCAAYGAPFPDIIAMNFISRRSPPTVPRRPCASCCSPTTPAAASSTASGCACAPSACVQASPTRRRPGSTPASSVSGPVCLPSPIFADLHTIPGTLG